MRMDKLTLKAQDLFYTAQEKATQHNHQEIQPVHLLSALTAQEDGLFGPIARRIGASPEQIHREAEEVIGKLPRQVGGGPGGAQMSDKLREVFNTAWNEAQKLKDEYLSSEHLLIAMATVDATHSRRILNAAGLNHDNILKALSELRGGKRVTDEHAEDRYNALERYARDLTILARQNRLDRLSAVTRKSDG
jgi:ATP-dependent Clp protease ATP-binding subunit ClpB